MPKEKNFNVVEIKKALSNRLALRYSRSRSRIEIDITYKCNLNCYNCNRICDSAPSDDRMTVGQIEKFIRSSIEKNIKWERLRIMGGEPTLHPDLKLILDLLIRFKKEFSPSTAIEVDTNCFGHQTKEVLATLPKECHILSSQKESRVQFFFPMCRAPCDYLIYKFIDYTLGCPISQNCGFGLTPYGFYPCALAGSIDRVFGGNSGDITLIS